MREHFKKLFQTNPVLLQRMLELRKQDPIKWNYSALGRHFHCDHTTCREWCLKKELIFLPKPPKIKGEIDHTHIAPQPLPIHAVFGEKINQGVLYQTYQLREKKRLRTKAELILSTNF